MTVRYKERWRILQAAKQNKDRREEDEQDRQTKS